MASERPDGREEGYPPAGALLTARTSIWLLPNQATPKPSPELRVPSYARSIEALVASESALWKRALADQRMMSTASSRERRAMSVNQTSASIPQAALLPSTRRRRVGSGGRSRRGAGASSGQHIAHPF